MSNKDPPSHARGVVLSLARSLARSLSLSLSQSLSLNLSLSLSLYSSLPLSRGGYVLGVALVRANAAESQDQNLALTVLYVP